MPAEIDHVTQIIKEKIKQLKAPAMLNQWQFKLIPQQGPSSTTLEGWQKVTAPHSWSSADGEGWFKTDLTLPSVVENIPLENSRVEFEFMLPIGAGIYLNGREVYREPSWTDSRAVRLELIKQFHPGTPVELEVHCNAQDGLAQFLNSDLVVSRLNEEIFKLDMVLAQIRFCHFLSDFSNEKQADYQNSLHMALESLDLKALSMNDWETWWNSVNAFHEKVAVFEKEAKTYTAHLIAHAHIDMNWLWSHSETIDICRRDFTAMLDLMDRYPEFHFSQSQTATYQFMQTDFPAVFEGIKDKVEEGRWDVTASTWVEGDLNMAAGETLARQLLFARRFSQAHFNQAPLICWEPDTFGHPASFPQLLRKSGIEFYYSCRGGKDFPLFEWVGIDGSRVLAVQDPAWYGGAVTPSAIVESVIKFASLGKTHHGLFVFGVGDHGGGATASDIEAARMINAAPFMPKAVSETTIPFFHESKSKAVNLPVVNSELNTVFEGCYTSHGDIKRLNRLCENLLLSAEAALAISAISTGKMISSLAGDWQTLCFHQFHDILCGCAIAITYHEARPKLEQVALNAEKAIDMALQAIISSQHPAHSKPAPGEEQNFQLVAFNPLGWNRSGLIHLSIDQLEGKIPEAMFTTSGKKYPVQVSGTEITFVADELPALGYQVFHPVYEPVVDVQPVVKMDPATQVIDNGILKLHISPVSGEIDYLEDLEAGRVLINSSENPDQKPAANYINRFELYWEEPHTMSAWVIGEISQVENLPPVSEVKTVTNNPQQVAIETRRIFLNSSMVQRISLSQKSRIIKFETEIDWHERGSSHTDAPMLRVAFAPLFDETNSFFEIPFAGLQREANGHEVPALRWADLSEKTGSFGISVLNDGKYGHSAEGDILRLTLLRASYEPDRNPDEGLHKFTYALYPHPGDWNKAQTIQKAAELNQPVHSAVVSGAQENIKPEESWLQCQSDSVLISAVKLAEDQPGDLKSIIVRLYETHGKVGTALLKIKFPIIVIHETNLLEQPNHQLITKNNSVQIDFSPYEIKTFKIQF